MLNIALLDDEKTALLICNSAIEEFFKQKNIEVTTDVYSSAINFVANIKEKNYKLVFLDIDMPEMSGIEVAKKIKENDEYCDVIFLSQREDLVFECLSTHPFGFIRKSKLIDDFNRVLNLYVSTTLKNVLDPRVIDININGTITRIKSNDLVYIEGNRNYQTFYYVDGRKEDFRIQMNVLEEKLKGNGFIRIHKGFLINYIFIRKINSKDVVMTDNKVLLMSRKRRDDIMEEYLKLTRNTSIFIN